MHLYIWIVHAFHFLLVISVSPSFASPHQRRLLAAHFDNNGHENENSQNDENHRVPVPHQKALQIGDTLFAEQQFPESGQRPRGVDLAAFLEDITVALVIITGRTRLGKHVWYIQGSLVKLETGLARFAVPWLFTA